MAKTVRLYGEPMQRSHGGFIRRSYSTPLSLPEDLVHPGTNGSTRAWKIKGSRSKHSFKPGHMLEKRPAEPGLQHLFAILVLLIAVIAMSFEHISSPKVHNGEAGPSAFSATRAMAHVRAIAGDAHPTGTAANDAMRKHLIDELRALGFQPEVQSGFSVGSAFKSPRVATPLPTGFISTWRGSAS